MNLGKSRISQIYARKQSELRKEYITKYFELARKELTISVQIQFLTQQIIKSHRLDQTLFNQAKKKAAEIKYLPVWQTYADLALIAKCLDFNYVENNKQNNSANSDQINQTSLFEKCSYFDLLILLLEKDLIKAQTSQQILFILKKNFSSFIEKPQNAIKNGHICYKSLILIKILLNSGKYNMKTFQKLQKNFKDSKKNSILVTIHDTVQRISENSNFSKNNQWLLFECHAKMVQIIICLSRMKNELFPIDLCVLFKENIIYNSVKAILFLTAKQVQKKGKTEMEIIDQKDQKLVKKEAINCEYQSQCLQSSYRFLTFLSIYLQEKSLKFEQQQTSYQEEIVQQKVLQEYWPLDENLFTHLLKVPNFIEKIKADLVTKQLSRTVLFFLNKIINQEQILKILIDHDILTALTIILIKGKIKPDAQEDINIYCSIFMMLVNILKLSLEIQDPFYQRVVREHYTSKYFLNSIGQFIFSYPKDQTRQGNYCSIFRKSSLMNPNQSAQILEILQQLLQVMMRKYNMNRISMFLEQIKSRLGNHVNIDILDAKQQPHNY